MKKLWTYLVGVWHIILMTVKAAVKKARLISARLLTNVGMLFMYWAGILVAEDTSMWWIALIIAVGVTCLMLVRDRALEYDRMRTAYEQINKGQNVEWLSDEKVSYQAVIETANGSELVMEIGGSSHIPEIEQWIEDGATPLEAWDRWFKEIYSGRWPGTRVVTVTEKHWP